MDPRYLIGTTADGTRPRSLPCAAVTDATQQWWDGEVLYQISVPHAPTAARGVRWNDPAFGIDWPEPPAERTISPRDAGYPDYSP